MLKKEDYRGVWVFLEQDEKGVARVSFELLGAGRRLADALGVSLEGVLIGSGVEKLAQSAFAQGADRVHLLDNQVYKDYRTEPFMRAFVKLVEELHPEIILMGATATGRDLASAVATELATGLTADCTGLDIEAETRNLLATRPAFGGNILATIVCDQHRPQMATVRPRVMELLPADLKRTGEIVKHDFVPEAKDIRSEVVRFLKDEDTNTVNLEDAEIIVAGGKGLGSPKNLDILRELADVLGGELGASRAIVDAGWLPYAHQVGQTGLTVRPKIYFAIGISGAIQHLAGMQTADVIVAINKDPKAPIFKVASYGIVGDLNKVVPALTEAFRRELPKYGSAAEMVKDLVGADAGTQGR